MKKIICGIFAVLVLLGIVGCQKTGENAPSLSAGQTETGNLTDAANKRP